MRVRFPPPVRSHGQFAATLLGKTGFSSRKYASLLFVKNGLWLSRRQIRWLIVLLALMPLVPTAMLVKSMFDTAQAERDLAVAEITEGYRNQAALLLDRFSESAEQTDSLEEYLPGLFGSDQAIQISSPKGKITELNSLPMTRDALSHQITTGRFNGWTVAVDGFAQIPDEINEQVTKSIQKAAWIVAGVLLAAGGVWFTIHRRLRIDELRSDVITAISHEIKTPVSAIKVLLETLEDSSESINRAEYLSLIGKENDRVAELAEQFLTYSRLEKGQFPIKMEECNLAQLIDRVAILERPFFDAVGGRLEVKCPKDIFLRTDPTALEIVVSNLIDNARKYGGSPPRCEIVLNNEGSDLSIRVVDNGKGIPTEERRAIFQRFYRTDSELHRKTGGTGLGLAISRKLVKLLRAGIHVESNQSGGASFVITWRNTQ